MFKHFVYKYDLQTPGTVVLEDFLLWLLFQSVSIVSDNWTPHNPCTPAPNSTLGKGF